MSERGKAETHPQLPGALLWRFPKPQSSCGARAPRPGTVPLAPLPRPRPRDKQPQPQDRSPRGGGGGRQRDAASEASPGRCIAAPASSGAPDSCPFRARPREEPGDQAGPFPGAPHGAAGRLATAAVFLTPSEPLPKLKTPPPPPSTRSSRHGFTSPLAITFLPSMALCAVLNCTLMSPETRPLRLAFRGYPTYRG